MKKQNISSVDVLRQAIINMGNIPVPVYDNTIEINRIKESVISRNPHIKANEMAWDYFTRTGAGDTKREQFEFGKQDAAYAVELVIESWESTGMCNEDIIFAQELAYWTAVKEEILKIKPRL